MKTVNSLLVIGVGLIGGSFAMALKKRGLVNHVVGYGRNLENLQLAIELGVIDEASQDLGASAAQADIIFVACPVGAMQQVLDEIAPQMSATTIITDGGSTKGTVIEIARSSLGSSFSRFVPGHPIAGSEKSGVGAAFAELYEEHRTLLTPSDETDEDAVSVVRQLWESIGASVTTLDAASHDRILALTSHLPHVLAYALVDQMLRLPDSESCFDLAAGGFFDFTRIASSNPVMWRDICLENRDKILQAIDGYSEALNRLRTLVADQDGDEIEAIFHESRVARNRLLGKRNPLGEGHLQIMANLKKLIDKSEPEEVINIRPEFDAVFDKKTKGRTSPQGDQ